MKNLRFVAILFFTIVNAGFERDLFLNYDELEQPKIPVATANGTIANDAVF